MLTSTRIMYGMIKQRRGDTVYLSPFERKLKQLTAVAAKSVRIALQGAATRIA